MNLIDLIEWKGDDSGGSNGSVLILDSQEYDGIGVLYTIMAEYLKNRSNVSFYSHLCIDHVLIKKMLGMDLSCFPNFKIVKSHDKKEISPSSSPSTPISFSLPSPKVKSNVIVIDWDMISLDLICNIDKSATLIVRMDKMNPLVPWIAKNFVNQVVQIEKFDIINKQVIGEINFWNGGKYLSPSLPLQKLVNKGNKKEEEKETLISIRKNSKYLFRTGESQIILI